MDDQNNDLKNVLVERETPKPFDPVSAAIAMLLPEEQKDFPKVISVGADWTDKERNTAHGRWKALNTGRRPEAYTEAGKNEIYMPTWTDTYRDGLKQNQDALRRMAALLAHERAHLQYGADEEQPYNIQLEILRRLGAREQDINDVIKARTMILSKRNK